MTQILVDSSFVVALNSQKDKYYEKATVFAEIIAAMGSTTFFMPEVVLTEVTYLIHREGGQLALLEYVERLRDSNPNLISLEETDFQRVFDILRLYRDADLDFVDCCLMAIAERLNITQICTFDRRDFMIFKPSHCEYFTLLP
jgi:predicted nucleic acid-binding protein